MPTLDGVLGPNSVMRFERGIAVESAMCSRAVRLDVWIPSHMGCVRPMFAVYLCLHESWGTRRAVLTCAGPVPSVACGGHRARGPNPGPANDENQIWVWIVCEHEERDTSMSRALRTRRLVGTEATQKPNGESIRLRYSDLFVSEDHPGCNVWSRAFPLIFSNVRDRRSTIPWG